MNKLILLMLIFPILAIAVPEQLMVQETNPWYVEYFWHALALFVSPIFGWCIGQRYKQRTPKPSDMAIINVAGGSTFAFAFFCWNRAYGWQDIEGALIIGLLMGVIQPLAVWLWYQYAKRTSPETAQRLKDSDDPDTTMSMFGGTVYKNTEDKTEPKE